MNPILMSDCGTEYIVDEKYKVEIEAGDYLILHMGFATSHAGSKFQHPNIAATSKVVHEFKHYRKGGSKFWTSKAGVDHILVIPRNKITLLPEKGYSYVPAEINGVKVKFNVSGGTSGDGWADWMHTNVHISVNHKMRDLRKLCEVAVRNSPFEPIVVEGLTEDDMKRWNRLAAKSIPDYKEGIAKMIEAGKKPIIKLLKGYRYEEAEAVDIRRRYKKVLGVDENHWTYEETGAPHRVIVDVGYKVAVKITQIDWHATRLANNLA